MIKKIMSSLHITKRDIFILLGLSFLYLIITIPGIAWGAPDIWNPDEIVKVVAYIDDSTMSFDQTNLSYPNLPKFIMLTIGRTLLALNHASYSIIVSSRMFSSFLGIMIIWITYFITRRVTSNPLMSIVSSLFIISNTEFVINSRFAHNDMYLVSFLMLSVFFLLLYVEYKKKYWLLASFAMTGFAAASKYNGGILILAPTIIYLVIIMPWKSKTIGSHIWTLLQGGIIALGAFILGNPNILDDPIKYINDLIPVLKNYALYDIQPGDSLGFLGQWKVLKLETLGVLIFYLLIISVIYTFLRSIFQQINIFNWNETKRDRIKVILLAILLYDIPIMISYNYVSRFFLFFVPLFSILGAVFIEDIKQILEVFSRKFSKCLTFLLLFISLGFSGLRITSTVLLFVNDARIPASEYILTLPTMSTIEYTYYHPEVIGKQFSRSHDYPLILIKYKDQVLPTSPYYEFNMGEEGIENRKTDYLIIDSIVYSRFESPFVCDLHPEDCEFFSKLFKGETNYSLVSVFKYDLPSYLPQIDVTFTNPDIYIFQRNDHQ